MRENSHAIAIDCEFTVLARNQMLFLELNQMLCYPRPRRANQLSNITMPSLHGKTDPFSISIADSEVLAQLQQDQCEALLERAIQEVRASQLDQVPAP